MTTDFDSPVTSRFELAAGVAIGGPRDFPIIAGPCVVENAETTFVIAAELARLAKSLEVNMIFKASFDKANRSSLDSFRSIGMEEALSILAETRKRTGLPLLTDVHLPEQVEPVAEVCDVLQIPAFLCRQTDLLLEAGRSGRAVNIKKGQFVAPDDMPRAADKVASTGNTRVCLTERGYSFGYNNLVVDMRSFSILHSHGLPVIFDATHSLQLPGGGRQTGGNREFAAPLSRAAVAAGADGIFMEVHPDPDNALSDRTTQLTPDFAGELLSSLLVVRRAITDPQRRIPRREPGEVD